jgi:hypothetical protein
MEVRGSQLATAGTMSSFPERVYFCLGQRSTWLSRVTKRGVTDQIRNAPVFHFTIRDVIHATIIVALSCALARYVGRDLLGTIIVASSASGTGIGLWCYVTGLRQSS